MKNIKVITIIHIIFVALIIAAFLPALNISSEGYNTKKAGVISTQQVDIVTKEVATEVENELASITVAEVDITKKQTPSVTMIEKMVEQEIVAEQLVVIEPALAVVDMAMIIPEPTSSVSETSSSTVVMDTIYSVIDGNKLDADSYAGFKLYRNWCARCHGTYGQGMVGPNLADSLKYIDKEQFYDTVEKGKSGTIGSMPAWRKNVKVMAGRDKLYAYLMARSDGAIGIEKPKKQ